MEIGVAPDGALLICTDNGSMKYTLYEGIGLSVGTYR